MIIKICKNVKDEILKTIGSMEAESGGVLACKKEKGIVDFYFDAEASCGKASYIPSLRAINRQVNEIWNCQGYYFGGIVHSHPEKASSALSKADKKMTEKIMHHNHLQEMIAMVVYRKNIFVWLFFLDEENMLRIEECDLMIDEIL